MKFCQLGLEGIVVFPDVLTVLASYQVRNDLGFQLRDNLARAIAFWSCCSHVEFQRDQEWERGSAKCH